MSLAKQKIDVPCPQCKAKLAVPITAMGKSGKCPHCGHIFPLAMPAQRPAAPMPATGSSPLTPLSPAGGADLGLTPLGGGDLMPLTDAELTPLPAASNLAPLAGNPFADAVPQGDYTLQPMAPAPYVAQIPRPTNASLASEYMANASASYEESKSRTYYSNSAGGGGGWGINAGIGGGAIMMLIAVVWCCAGLIFFDFFFFAPPVIFVIGLIAFFKGIFDNFSA